LLDVPYVSQKAPGSYAYYNDCGAACMPMILKAYSLAKDLIVDDFFDMVNPTGDVGLSAGAIVAFLKPADS
jgi:hypothetical protein